MNTPLLSVERVRWRGFVIGILLIITGICMPYFLSVTTFGIPKDLSLALASDDNGAVLIAAIKLVALNTLRALPHYLGAFFAAESIEFSWKGRRTHIPNFCFIVVAILFTYRMIDIVHHIHYDFGAPALIVTATLLLLSRLDYDLSGSWKKPLMLVVFLTAFQFLDVIPALGSLPFGRGETSQDVKLSAMVLGTEDLLNLLGFLLFAVLMSMGVLFFMLVRGESHLREINHLREQNQYINTQTMLRDMENRTYMEMQHLVHDLKSPLTSIQTLVGIIKLESERDNREQDIEFLGRIEHGIENMSTMISELLNADVRSVINTEALLDIALAQISELDYSEIIITENHAPDANVRVNRVLFARALVNLINNAASAVRERADGSIHIYVDRDSLNDEGVILIAIEDNGIGIAEDELERVWQRGYSTIGSHGLGLSFVKNVVERSDGSISMESREDYGTSVCLTIPEEV